jgi:glutamyl-tRNA reductase
VTTHLPQTAHERVQAEREREQLARHLARTKRERGEAFLARLYERSADAHAAMAAATQRIIDRAAGKPTTSIKGVLNNGTQEAKPGSSDQP